MDGSEAGEDTDATKRRILQYQNYLACQSSELPITKGIHAEPGTISSGNVFSSALYALKI